MINTLLITNTLEKSPSGGRQLLCKLNYDVLKDIYGEDLILIELSARKPRSVQSVIKAFGGYIDGLTDDVVSSALATIKSKNIGKVFVDGSNLGGIVKAVKENNPGVEVITFFHNVEARFFVGALCQKYSFRSLIVLIVNYLAERKSVKYADKIICLSDRDSFLLKKVYRRAATHVSAMALQDKLPADIPEGYDPPSEKYALFVGGDFYANRAGISWFVKNVSPHIDIKTYIVGRGFEELKSELNIDGKVEVIGEVDSLAQWYLGAYFVIAPIFDGSGMKTKVAEALMFGKKIIGTPEAFSGYEVIADQAGRVCSSADDFVLAIEAVDEIVKHSFDDELRKLYEDRYSYPAAKSRLEKILS